ncbi:MAG: glycosyltransferase [archaeon]|nr:glycosyltransferase [archaeon]
MRNKIKVVIIGPSKKFLSGISYYTIRLSNALSDATDVETILFRKMLPKRLFPGWRRVGEELTTQNFDKRVNVYEILDWYNPVTWMRAFRIVKEADVIVFQWWTSSVAHMYLALELLNLRRRPIIIEFHEVVDPLESSILPIRIYSKLMGKVIRRLATRYVVHSNSDKELISKNYGIEEEIIEVIPHGIYDHYKKRERDIAKAIVGIKEDFVILFFGLLRPYKGVKYLIKAFESLPEDVVEKSRLLIVGETWEDKETKELARVSKFSNKIKVVDRYVSDDEISLYFSASDVLVVPYTRASQSGVAHIGMTFGMPIIASEVGGLKDSLGKYEGTVFVQPRSTEDITTALMYVFDEQRREFETPEELRWKEIAKKWFKLVNLVRE